MPCKGCKSTPSTETELLKKKLQELQEKTKILEEELKVLKTKKNLDTKNYLLFND